MGIAFGERSMQSELFSTLVGSTHQFKSGFNMPPSLGFFAIALLLERACFLGCNDNGAVTARFE
jgi:hypothetical protein